jgi:hypothetical protein
MIRVKRKAYMIGALAVILVLHSAQGAGAYFKIVQSAQNFQRYYSDLKQGQNSLTPIERIVFSLVLSTSKTPAQTTANDLPVGRT